jgi:hypothetical protein
LPPAASWQEQATCQGRILAPRGVSVTSRAALSGSGSVPLRRAQPHRVVGRPAVAASNGRQGLGALPSPISWKRSAR